MQLASMLPVLIHGLKPLPTDPASHAKLAADSYATLPPIRILVPEDSTESDVVTILKADGYRFVDLELDPSVQLTIGASNSFDATCLKISRDTTFISFHDAWARKKGLPDDSGDVDGASYSTLSGGEIQVESTSLGVQATLRVPTGSQNKLPVGLGQLPLKPLAECEAVPESMRQRGGFIAPLWQSEALMMTFRDWSGRAPAVKVSVKGINAVTGLPMGQKSEGEVQDYVVPGIQPWLDGVTLKPGVTSQFVAAPISTSGFPDHSPITLPTHVSGLQFDFFRRLNADVVVSVAGRTLSPAELLETPSSLGLTGTISMSTKSRRSSGGLSLYKNATDGSVHFNVIDSPLRGRLTIFVRFDSQGSRGLFGQPNARGESLLAVSADPDETVDRVLEKLQVLLKNAPGTHAWIEMEGKELEGRETLAELGVEDRAFLRLKTSQEQFRDYDAPRGGGLFGSGRGFGAAPPEMRMMAFASTPLVAPVDVGQGGEVEQRILPDPTDVRCYSSTSSHRVFIHTVSPAAWEQLTGEPCPPSLATRETYRANALPWLDSYTDTPLKKRKVVEVKDGKIWVEHLDEDQVAPLAGKKKETVAT